MEEQTREVKCLSCGKDFTVKEMMVVSERPKCNHCAAVHELDIDSDGDYTFWYLYGLIDGEKQ